MSLHSTETRGRGVLNQGGIKILTMNPWERSESRGRERLGTYLNMTSTGPGFRHFVLPRAMTESISDSTERIVRGVVAGYVRCGVTEVGNRKCS